MDLFKLNIFRIELKLFEEEFKFYELGDQH